MSISLDGLYSGYSDTYTSASARSNAAADALKDKISSTDYSKSTDDELLNVCKEFESYLVEQVIKEMKKMIPENDDKDSTSAKYLDFFGDNLTQELASTITESNNGEGLGIARTLYEQMKRNYGITEEKTATDTTEEKKSTASVEDAE